VVGGEEQKMLAIRHEFGPAMRSEMGIHQTGDRNGASREKPTDGNELIAATRSHYRECGGVKLVGSQSQRMAKCLIDNFHSRHLPDSPSDE
jgi:hypothetical protein